MSDNWREFITPLILQQSKLYREQYTASFISSKSVLLLILRKNIGLVEDFQCCRKMFLDLELGENTMFVEDDKPLSFPKVKKLTILKLALLVSIRFNVPVSAGIFYFSITVGCFQTFILLYKGLQFKPRSANKASINPFHTPLQTPKITETYYITLLIESNTEMWLCKQMAQRRILPLLLLKGFSGILKMPLMCF